MRHNAVLPRNPPPANYIVSTGGHHHTTPWMLRGHPEPLPCWALCQHCSACLLLNIMSNALFK
ncbi:hypothetical protein BDW75DRAFT_169427 [Aspergillus navahoensis]